jgi:glycyl-tRNA synthetase beta chain
LYAAYKRAANILRIEDTKDGPHSGPPDESLFDKAERTELEFNHAMVMTSSVFENAIATEDFGKAVTFLSAVRAKIDAFFDKVTVNAPEPDLRRNRLRLLARFRDTVHQIADFSKIEG